VAAGLTQAQMAARCGVSNVAVSQWETGASSPGAKRLPMIAKACGVSMRVFFGDLPKARQAV
jgi:transcriptional regulator with XRE-family HTH domain